MGSAPLSELPVTTEQAQRRLAIAQVLFATAGVVLAGIFSGVLFVLDKREPGPAFWILLLAAIALLVYSFIAGAQGVEKLDLQHPHFDRQAKALLAGFVLLAGSPFLLGPDKADQQALSSAVVQGELRALREEMNRQAVELKRTQQGSAAQQTAIEKLRAEVDAARRVTPPPPKKKAIPAKPAPEKRAAPGKRPPAKAGARIERPLRGP